MWFKGRQEKEQQGQQKQLDILKAHLFDMKKRLREIKREFAEFKRERQQFNDKLLLQLGRIEGVLGIGFGSSPVDEGTPASEARTLEFKLRQEQDEAERIALEQLGTGGSAQGPMSAIAAEKSEEEG